MDKVPATAIGEIVLMNPHSTTKRIVEHFQTLIARLQDVQNQQLRTNFERVVDTFF